MCSTPLLVHKTNQTCIILLFERRKIFWHLVLSFYLTDLTFTNFLICSYEPVNGLSSRNYLRTPLHSSCSSHSIWPIHLAFIQIFCYYLKVWSIKHHFFTNVHLSQVWHKVCQMYIPMKRVLLVAHCFHFRLTSSR